MARRLAEQVKFHAMQLVGFANNQICRSCKENVITRSQEFRGRESEWPAKNSGKIFLRSGGPAEGCLSYRETKH
jgi:hypothetical protein